MFHVVWSTYGRLATLGEDLDQTIALQLSEIVEKLGCSALAVGNAADHVHALVRVTPNIALSTLVQRMKGATSHALRLHWQVGYYAESIAVADVTNVAKYIHRQRTHHDASHPLEAWSETA